VFARRGVEYRLQVLMNGNFERGASIFFAAEPKSRRCGRAAGPF
jgi:hypothetical protein